MADEAKLCSSIHSTFEVLVVRPMVGCCHGEESGPFCWPMPAAGIAVFGASYQFAETLRCSGFAGIQKVVVDQTVSRPPEAMTFICLKFGFGKSFGYSSQSSNWPVLCQLLYKIHFSSHIKIPSRSDDTSKLYIYNTYIWPTNEALRYQATSPFKFASSAKWP